jgi:alpha-L-fucosidase
MSGPDKDVIITSLATDKGLAGKISKVELLGHTGKLKFTQDSQGLHVEFPAEKPCDYAYVLKIAGLLLQ